jgi:hypothetical protein
MILLSKMAAGTTWNPNDKAANTTLSNGNLTASCNFAGSGFSNVRSTTGATGQKYFEITVVAASGPNWGNIFGVADASESLTAQAGVAAGGHSAGTQFIGGASLALWFNGSSVNVPYASLTVGDVMGVCVDTVAAKLWFNDLTRASGWTNGGTGFGGNPTNGTGGYSISGIGSPIYIIDSGYGDSTTQTFTVNPGPTGFTGTIPTGFAAWQP